MIAKIIVKCFTKIILHKIIIFDYCARKYNKITKSTILFYLLVVRTHHSASHSFHQYTTAASSWHVCRKESYNRAQILYRQAVKNSKSSKMRKNETKHENLGVNPMLASRWQRCLKWKTQFQKTLMSYVKFRHREHTQTKMMSMLPSGQYNWSQSCTENEPSDKTRTWQWSATRH